MASSTRARATPDKPVGECGQPNTSSEPSRLQGRWLPPTRACKDPSARDFVGAKRDKAHAGRLTPLDSGAGGDSGSRCPTLQFQLYEKPASRICSVRFLK